jgi:outer membrane lipoprotein carrier protein
MKATRCLIALSLLTLATQAQAGARERLDAFTGGLQGLSSTFEQKVYAPGGQLNETSTGTVQLQAPRLFRWEYVSPFPNLIVADGDHIWIYDPDLEQVTVRQQSLEEQNSPLAVLIDPGELDRQFHAKDAGTAEGLEWVELTPKKADDAPFERARLGMGAQGLARMELFDGLGQRTVMAFQGWKRNPAFAKGTFTFVPPKGVDVVGEVAEGAEVMPLDD